MVPIIAPRFRLTECPSERERGFVEALHARAEAGDWYADSWWRDDRVIITVDVVDPARRWVLQMLRIDFDGQAVTFGPDETFQLATDLAPQRPGVFSAKGRPVVELAAVAADWLEQEMARYKRQSCVLEPHESHEQAAQ